MTVAFLTPSAVDKAFSLHPQTVAKRMLVVITVLALLNLFAIFLFYGLNNDGILTRRLFLHFGLNEEGNISTYFSTLQLLVASALLAVVAKQAPTAGIGRRWWFLSAVFLFLSIDESTSIHEELTRTTNATVFHDVADNTTRLGGYMHYSWVLPYLLLLGLLTVAYARFIWELPPRIRTLFVVSAVIFVMGAAGLEMLEGKFYLLYGKHNVLNSLACVLEESMEMLGVTIFIYALLLYIGNTHSNIRLNVSIRPKEFAS
jgi:hypothetical protein